MDKSKNNRRIIIYSAAAVCLALAVFLYLYINNIILVTYVEHGLILSKTDTEKGFSYDVYVDGKHMPLKTRNKKISINPGVASFKYRGGNIVQFINYVEPLNEKIMARSASSIDLEYSGSIDISDTFTVYSLHTKDVSVKSPGSILVGAENISFYKDRTGRIKTAVINGDTPLNFMRVGIKTEGFQGFGHSMLEFTSDAALRVEDKKANQYMDIPPKSKVQLSPADDGIWVTSGDASNVYKNRIYIYPKDKQTFTKVLSYKRSYGLPSYRGSFEVTCTAGKLNLINEVPLESYLCQVVPSEMPSSFGLEALKAQAVAARTYAVSDLLSSRYAASGFHVDDSTMSQVYNNVQENPLATRAVNETKGLVMKYDGNLVDAKYYSTSHGYGVNSDEIWSSNGKFPGNKSPYFEVKSYLLDGRQYNLSLEEEAVRFFKDWTLKSYDSNSPYFRWKVTFKKDELKNTIEKNLPSVYKDQEDYILTLNNGKYESIDIPDNCIGELQDMKVAMRGEGGSIMELLIVGSKGTYKIIKELNVRYVLRPRKEDTGSDRDITIKRIKSGDLKNPSLLPSAFMVFDISRDEAGEITDVTFYGGGYGHGVGMSQYGAGYLASKGSSYLDILKTYYKGISIERLN